MATKMLAIISARLQLKGCDTLLLCFICNPSAMACFEVAMMDLTYRSTALEALVVRTKHPAVPPPGGSPQVWHRRGIGPPGIHNPNSGTRIHRACLTLFLCRSGIPIAHSVGSHFAVALRKIVCHWLRLGRIVGEASPPRYLCVPNVAVMPRKPSNAATSVT